MQKTNAKTTLVGAILFFSLIGFAKSSPTPRENPRRPIKKLVIIASTEGEPYVTTLKHFYKQLEKRDLKRNENLEVIEYFIGNHEDVISNIWKHIIKPQGVEVIYVSGTTANIGARKYLWDKNVKVVFSDVTDPIGIGLIDNFNQPPKNNFTGVCFSVPVVEKIRFVKKLFPKLKNIGYVYADMTSSTSYLAWLQEELKKPEFKGLNLISEKIPFVAGEGGYIRMSQIAQEIILRMNSQVDVFWSPSDSLGGQKVFVNTMEKFAQKPLIGLQERETVEGWGATASNYIPLDEAGTIAADMIVDLFNQKDIKSLVPKCPKGQVAFDMNKIEKFKLRIPQDLKERARIAQAKAKK